MKHISIIIIKMEFTFKLKVTPTFYKKHLLFVFFFDIIKNVEKYTHRRSIKLMPEKVVLYEEICGG